MDTFSAMEVLDGDDVRLSSRGRYAERDIVQVSLMRNLEVPDNTFYIIIYF